MPVLLILLSHLIVGEFGATLPTAGHARARRSSVEIDGGWIQPRNRRPNPAPAAAPAPRTSSTDRQRRCNQLAIGATAKAHPERDRRSHSLILLGKRARA